jgi:GT2 family glycosyltransferase
MIHQSSLPTGDTLTKKDDKVKSLNVIVVNFRTPGLTIKCVESMVAQAVAKEEEIIVVDNFSQDDSLPVLRARLPAGVQLIASDRNAGFGAGVNVGIRHANAEYLLVLNPDTYFEFNSVARVLDYMSEDQSVGLVGLDLVNPDRSRQYSARRFYSVLDIGARRISFLGKLFRGRIDHHLMRDAWMGRKPFAAEWVMGTGFVIRNDVCKQLNGMDEEYFLYMEDVDLCARTWRAGFKVICFPGAQLVHDHQRSSAAGPFTFAGRMHLRSLLRFARRFTLPLIKSPGLDKIRNS